MAPANKSRRLHVFGSMLSHFVLYGLPVIGVGVTSRTLKAKDSSDDLEVGLVDRAIQFHIEGALRTPVQ